MTHANETRPEALPIAWDTEDRNDLLPKEASISGTSLYISAPLLEWMENVLGGVLNFIKTRTSAETGEVWLAKAAEGEAGAVPLRRLGTQNIARCSFWRPLRKLNIKVPKNRQFNLRPVLHRVNDDLTVFVLKMSDRVSVPRKSGPDEAPEDEAAAGKQ